MALGQELERSARSREGGEKWWKVQARAGSRCQPEPGAPAQPSVLGVACLEHRGETSRLFFAALFCARLLKPAAQPELLKRLLPIQFLLEPANSFFNRLALFQFNFRHKLKLNCCKNTKRARNIPRDETYQDCPSPRHFGPKASCRIGTTAKNASQSRPVGGPDFGRDSIPWPERRSGSSKD